MVSGDAHGDSTADGFASEFPGDHVGVAGRQPGEEFEEGDLEVRGGVGVDTVVGLDDDEAAGLVGCGGEGGAEASGVGC